MPFLPFPGRMLMDAFDWKNGLFIMAAVVLNCVVCGALMRPLVPTKKPRKKNFFDRFVSSLLPSYNVFLAELSLEIAPASGGSKISLTWGRQPSGNIAKIFQELHEIERFWTLSGEARIQNFTM